MMMVFMAVVSAVKVVIIAKTKNKHKKIRKKNSLGGSLPLIMVMVVVAVSVVDVVDVAAVVVVVVDIVVVVVELATTSGEEINHM